MKHLHSLRTKLFLLALFFLSLVSPLGADAKLGGVTVEPLFREVTIKEGNQKETFPVTIKNSGSFPLQFSVSVIDFGSLDETGGVAFQGAHKELDKKYALASWMRPEKDTLSLDGGESETVEITIENRESLSPGGHYAAILFTMAGKDAGVEAENTVAIQQIFSVLVFVKKEGGEIYDLKLSDIEMPGNVFTLPQEVQLKFQNNGNVHVIPRGIVSLRDTWGRVVRKGIINQESSILLPETIRKQSVSLVDTKNIAFPGYYQWSIEYRYDGKNSFEEYTGKSFFYFPFFTFISITLTVMIVILRRRILDVLFKKRSNKVLKVQK